MNESFTTSDDHRPFWRHAANCMSSYEAAPAGSSAVLEDRSPGGLELRLDRRDRWTVSCRRVRARPRGRRVLWGGGGVARGGGRRPGGPGGGGRGGGGGGGWGGGAGGARG